MAGEGDLLLFLIKVTVFHKGKPRNLQDWLVLWNKNYHGEYTHSSDLDKKLILTEAAVLLLLSDWLQTIEGAYMKLQSHQENLGKEKKRKYCFHV